MLDARDLATRRDEIEESCRKRGYTADVDAAIAAQEGVSALQTELNEANRLRNEHQRAGKQKLDDAARRAHVEEGRRLKEVVAALEARAKEARALLDEHLLGLPNFIHPEVPEGGEDAYNALRTWGEIPRFDFEPLDHLALAERLDLVDFRGGAKVAGQKWYYLKNEAVLLELALQRFSIDRVIEHGFTPMTTPDVVRREIVEGIGFNPRGEETQTYYLEGGDLGLVGTAEITLGGLYKDEIIDEDDLPLKIAGLSHCFRTEAGTHGRESRGLYRVHQFTKTEMFVFTRPEDSEAMLDTLVGIEEQIFQDLEIPFRVIDTATRDLGAPAYRKFDLEAWLPGRGDGGDWGEVTSASNCTDFQARRLKIRFRRKGTRKNEFVHTLNGTAVSNSRCLVALFETHQRADGSIAIPKALQPYAGLTVIGPR
jgi:seryl-tRNA synthetase